MVMYLLGCFSQGRQEPDTEIKLVLDWNAFMLYAETNTEGYRGPVAARAYGYIGLAAYEAARTGLKGEFVSFAERYPGLTLPMPPPDEKFDPGIALNACYSTIMHAFFLSATDDVRKELRAKEASWNATLRSGKDKEIVARSAAFGQDVANAVFAWSATDTFGFRSNHHNYLRDYSSPSGDGLWVPSAQFPMPPLLPYWGNVRPFVIHPDNHQVNPPPPFSAEKDQAYYKQALELVSLSSPLTRENQWIAEFWNDDHPGMTFTPPGHWIAILNQVIAKENPSLEKVLEAYLKVGMAMSDAFVVTWKAKYEYNLIRPETFIQKYIDPNWRPFSPSPSFPAYPSGHSVIGAAASEVLTSMFGDNYAMLDRSHESNKEAPIKPREFSSFKAMAEEEALSRLLLGVHWRMDSEEGLRIGRRIGKEVSVIGLDIGPME